MNQVQFQLNFLKHKRCKSNLFILEASKDQEAGVRIAKDLVSEKYLLVVKEGRINKYSINFSMPLRHPLELNDSIGEILKALAK